MRNSGLLAVLLLGPCLFPVRFEPPHPSVQILNHRLALYAAGQGVDLPRVHRVFGDYHGLRQAGLERAAVHVARREMRGPADVQAFELLLELQDVQRRIRFQRLAAGIAAVPLPPDEPEHPPFPTYTELAAAYNTLLETNRPSEALWFAFHYRLNIQVTPGGDPALIRIVQRRERADGGVRFRTAVPMIEGRRIKVSKSGRWIDRFALYRFRFANGAKATGTRDHEMLRLRGGRLEKVPLRLLRPGDLAMDARGRRVPLVSMLGINPTEHVPVYNLTVAGAHTYFVGGSGPDDSILVHNANPEEYVKPTLIASNKRDDLLGGGGRGIRFGGLFGGNPGKGVQGSYGLPAPRAGVRNLPGIARSGPGLKNGGSNWLRGSNQNAARFPKEIAARLEGREFKNMSSFRKAFWKEVARTPHLAKQFPGREQLRRMEKGLAPIARPEQQVGKSRSYVLHHSKPISRGGQPYDMNNIQIVTPRYHKEALSKSYHYGKQ